jgi:hypothetical protein
LRRTFKSSNGKPQTRSFFFLKLFTAPLFTQSLSHSGKAVRFSRESCGIRTQRWLQQSSSSAPPSEEQIDVNAVLELLLLTSRRCSSNSAEGERGSERRRKTTNTRSSACQLPRSFLNNCEGRDEANYAREPLNSAG